MNSKPLGEGKFGSVYPINKSLMNADNKRHEKLLKLAKVGSTKAMEAISNEIKITEEINAKDMNGKITPKISTIIYNNFYEKCGYYMHKFDNTLKNDTTKINPDILVIQLVNRIINLHSLNIAHCDIHDNNIVIRSQNNRCDIKLIDLGSAKHSEFSKEYARDCLNLLSRLEKYHNGINFDWYALAERTDQEIQEVVYALSCRKDIEYKTDIGKKISECMNEKSKCKYSKKLQDVFGENGILTKHLIEMESELDKKEEKEENASKNVLSNQSKCESQSSFKGVNFKK